jgi:hypothetical protein
MLRTVLIAFALALALPPAACAAPRAQDGAQLPRHPDAIMCAGPGAPLRWIPVPAGRKPADLCPGGNITDVLYHNSSDVPYQFPLISGAAPPLVPSGTEGHRP